MRPLACLLGLALLATTGSARAETDDSAATDKIVKLNKRAVDEYENLNFDEARKILNTALAACAQSGLENHPVAARTHVHLGVVLFAGFKQKDQAVKEFHKALEIQADIKLDKTLANPEIQAVFDEAAGAQKGESGATSTAPAAADAVTHEPVTRAEQGKDIPINVTIDSSVNAKKVVLSFSADGSEDFGEREMKEESPGNWSGQIPSSATEGAKVRYYIEVSGADDQTLATKGTAAAPLVVALRPSSGAAAPMRRNTIEAAPKKEEAEAGAPSWYFGLGLGSGFGWTTGTGEINSLDHVSPPGFAAAKLGQLVPEVGYFVMPQLLVSFQFRYQLVQGATAFFATDGSCGPSTVCSPASYALAGFGRASWLFDLGSLHPFAGGTLGAGTIRHLATFPSEPHCGSTHTSTCIDTIASGPIFVGGTGGLLYNLSPFFALMAETNVVAGFTKFTFNFDFNLGVAVEY
jgi:Tetratricopeptide repeat